MRPETMQTKMMIDEDEQWCEVNYIENKQDHQRQKEAKTKRKRKDEKRREGKKTRSNR